MHEWHKICNFSIIRVLRHHGDHPLHGVFEGVNPYNIMHPRIAAAVSKNNL